MTNFIVQNSMWILLVCLFILMIVIGYMSDDKKKRAAHKRADNDMEKESNTTDDNHEFVISTEETLTETPTSSIEEVPVTSPINQIEVEIIPPEVENQAEMVVETPVNEPVVETEQVNEPVAETQPVFLDSFPTPPETSEMPVFVSSMEDNTPTVSVEEENSNMSSESTSVSEETTPVVETKKESIDFGVDDVSSAFGEPKKEASSDTVPVEDVWKF